jgi:putative tricarboxylic transport membrane protein
MTAADLIAAAVAILAAAWTFIESARWPAPDFVGGPALIPRMVAAVLVLAAAIIAWRALTGRSSAVEQPVAPRERGRIVAATLLTVGLALALDRIGFLPAAILYLAGFALILGASRPLPLLGFSVGLPVGMYLLFDRLLRVPLPDIPFLS